MARQGQLVWPAQEGQPEQRVQGEQTELMGPLVLPARQVLLVRRVLLAQPVPQEQMELMAQPAQQVLLVQLDRLVRLDIPALLAQPVLQEQTELMAKLAPPV